MRERAGRPTAKGGRRARRPHVVGIDDGPFEKHSSPDTPLVAVVMEGPDLVEGVAVARFPVDGNDAGGFLTGWIRGLRFHPGLQGIVLGGITLAGLGVVDIEALAEGTGVPVLVVNRRDPATSRLTAALRAAGLEDRVDLISRAPVAFRSARGVFLACAGIGAREAEALVEAVTGKADLPEPLRLAHLIAAAIARGSSHGRV
ncbi:MAG: DUF99 family protein [Myxococcota bacterium]